MTVARVSRRTQLGSARATLLIFAAVAAGAVIVQADPPPPTLWTRQTGTSTFERAEAVAVDGSGNIYITGDTYGPLGGPNQGLTDAFLVKYDGSGALVWARQTGSIVHDRSRGIAIDGAGSSYIAGWTEGDLGGPNQGESDAFIVKHDANGTLQWARQVGSSPGLFQDDWAHAVAVDAAGNSYSAGYTYGDLGAPSVGSSDAFVVACDSGGTVQWTQQIGTPSQDRGRGIAIDGSGNVYLAGYTGGDLGGPSQYNDDAFVVKYDNGGTVQWARQIGSSEYDSAVGIAADASGNTFITGYTDGDLAGPNQGGADAFVAMFDSSGTLQWTRQIGSGHVDRAHGIAIDGSGNVYITGYTYGELGGPGHGLADAFIVAYDTSGAVRWTRQMGTPYNDHAYGIAVDDGGTIYVTGYTDGDLGGPNQGCTDVFVAAIASYPATAGDANLDGCVDGLDYVIWSSNYDSLAGGKTWQHADFNEDQSVDGLDYILWSSNYLQGCPASPGAVPEPCSGLLLVAGSWAVVRRRRCRKHLLPGGRRMWGER